MPTITVEPELYELFERAAAERRTGVNVLFAEAARRFVWELNRHGISAECEIYRQRHAELKTQFLGRYIAMRNGHVVDHDADFQALRRRVRERFGRAPVMITLVTDEADPPLTRSGFRWESPVL